MNSIIISRFLLGIIAIAYLAYPNVRPDFTVYNSHDSESYIAISKNMLDGRGYTRSLNEGEFIPHTLWPPGMATLLAPAVFLSGDTINLSYIKYSMIFIALLGLWLTRQYLMRILAGENVANLVVLLLALNPFYWHFSRLALAEIPVFTWAILSLLIIDHIFRPPKLNFILIAVFGAFIGLGMLLKGALLGLILSPIPYLWKRGLFSKESIKHGPIYAICFCIPFCIWMYSNHNIERSNLGLDGVNQIQMITKKVIEDPRSESKTAGEIITTAKQNILWHAIYHIPNHIIPSLFIADLKTVKYGNVLALLLTITVSVFIISQFSHMAPLILSVTPVLFLVSVMTIGGAERYWFTITSILFLPFYLSLVKIFKSKKFLIFTLIAIQVIGLSYFIKRHEQQPYTEVESRHDLASLFFDAIPICKESSSLAASNTWTKNEHAFQLMTGCKASMVNVAISRNPKFTHAILYLPNVTTPLPESILQSGDYAWITLPKLMTRLEITNAYY